MTKEEMAKDMANWFEGMKKRIVSVTFPSCWGGWIKFSGERMHCSYMVKWDLPIVMISKAFEPTPCSDVFCGEMEAIEQARVFCFLMQDETIRQDGSFYFVVLPENDELRKRALFILNHLPLQKDDGQEAGWLYSLDFDKHEMPIRKLAELYGDD